VSKGKVQARILANCETAGIEGMFFIGALNVLLLLQLLCSAIVSARVLTPPGEDPSVPSTHKYQHIDPSSGSHMTCDKCPAGTFVSSHCSPSSYTRGENGIEQCHRCREPCPAELVEKTPCSAILDRVCSCPAGTFLSEGVRCKPHSQCPPGTRVKRRGSETEDVLCKPCGKGTFSEGNTSAVRCRTHQDCQAQGLVLITPGARERDNVCGPPSSHPIIGTSSITPSHTSTTEPPTSTKKETMHIYIIWLPFSVLSGTDVLESVDTVKLGTGVNKVNGISSSYRPTRRGSPRPSTTEHFDINEHLPWMIVLLLLLVLVVIVVCSVKRSSRVLKKGPVQDPTSIMEKAIHKKPHGPPTQKWEKWIYYSNGQGVDILKLVAAHVGSQWIDLYQSLANATEREVAAFSNGYCSDPERAYAALQHWTIRDSDANLAKLINALHRHRRIDVVEKVRCTMEDNPQVTFKLNFSFSLAFPSPAPPRTRVERAFTGYGVGMEPSPSPKGFFPDESEPLLRCDSTSSKDSALSRNGSFITKEKKDTVLRQVRLDPCDLQPVFDEMLHILNPEELHALEQIPSAEDKLDRLFEIAGVKSQEASQTLLDSVYSHLPDLL
uniref:Tumor necrosis factor receptor superfamily, member 21 n=1 Tax=Neogobius melanostomus TaxID=47308 RepID=A0A8C6S353_9GOBI